MRHAGTIRGLTSQEACSLVYQYLYNRVDAGQRQRLKQHKAQFTATSLCGNCWQVFTWLAGFGQWHVRPRAPIRVRAATLGPTTPTLVP